MQVHTQPSNETASMGAACLQTYMYMYIMGNACMGDCICMANACMGTACKGTACMHGDGKLGNKNMSITACMY